MSSARLTQPTDNLNNYSAREKLHSGESREKPGARCVSSLWLRKYRMEVIFVCRTLEVMGDSQKQHTRSSKRGQVVYV